MAEPWTPSTDDVRDRYSDAVVEHVGETEEESLAQFDRWIIEHDQKVREPLEARIAAAKAAVDADYGLRVAANLTWHILDGSAQASPSSDTDRSPE